MALLPILILVPFFTASRKIYESDSISTYLDNIFESHNTLSISIFYFHHNFPFFLSDSRLKHVDNERTDITDFLHILLPLNTHIILLFLSTLWCPRMLNKYLLTLSFIFHLVDFSHILFFCFYVFCNSHKIILYWIINMFVWIWIRRNLRFAILYPYVAEYVCLTWVYFPFFLLFSVFFSLFLLGFYYYTREPEYRTIKFCIKKRIVLFSFVF